MEYVQRGRDESLDSIARPIQAKEGAGRGGDLGGGGGGGAAPEGAAPEGAEHEGAEVEGAEPWAADSKLMSAMGLPELGESAESPRDGQADAAKQRVKRRRRGKGQLRGPGAEGGASGEAAGAGPVQRKGLGEVTDLLGGRGESTASSALGAVPTSGGAPLDRGIASGVERATGQQVGDVRVHTDETSAAAANAISARAFTSGNNIHLGKGESASDAKLMSHEVAHTIQQTQGAKVADGVSRPTDSLEIEADRVAEAAISGGSASVSTAVGGSLMRDAVSDVEALLSYGAFDWAITDDEATQALGILAAMPTAQLNGAIGRLGQTYKTRLLENLPEAAKRTSGYTKVLVAMGPDAVLPYVSGLLSYGIFDWAVTDAEAAEVFQIIKALPAAQQGTLANRLGATFRSRLASNLKRVSVIGPDEYAVLRVMFDSTPAAEVDTLCNWTALRFNLRVTSSTDSDGAPWDKRGLTRCWDVLAALPPEHVESNGDLKSLTRYRTGGGISGWASNSGEAAIGYGDTTDLAGATNQSQAGDPLHGVNRFDKVVRHEVGHRVDARVGGPAYTASEPGGSWQTWDSVDGVAERMVTASGGKISTWANADQKRAIIDCLQTIVADRKPNLINARLEALPFLSSHATDAAQLALLNDIKGDNAVAALRTCFSDQAPWYTATGGVVLGDRIFQESYDWPQWVSYKAEARTRKLSQYQFRAPGEWFAEAYAAYYEPPGAKGALLVGRDDATKAWFDSSVDPQNGAGGTVPAAAGAAPAGGAPAGAAPAGGAPAGGAPAGGP